MRVTSLAYGVATFPFGKRRGGTKGNSGVNGPTESQLKVEIEKKKRVTPLRTFLRTNKSVIIVFVNNQILWGKVEKVKDERVDRSKETEMNDDKIREIVLSNS